MGTSAHTSSPAFTRLPVELLIIILDQRYSGASLTSWWDIIDFSTLKSLRLACRQYAYLPRVLEKLFHTIRLVASPEDIHLVETFDLSLIKPYITKVVLKPSKYSWDMTKDIFEDIVMITPLIEHCNKLNKKKWEIRDAGGDVSKIPNLGREQLAKLGMGVFVQQYMNGPMPFSDVEINAGFERYMLHAQRTRRMFEEEQVQRVWTKVLAQLPDVHDFKISKWDYDYTSKESWRDLGCEVNGHRHYHGKGHDEAVCREVQGPVGEALSRAVIAAFVAARSSIALLDIDCILTNNFAWAENGALDRLDLSNLKSLDFGPRLPESYVDSETGLDHEAVVTARCNLAVTTLLRQCSASLQVLSVFSGRTQCCLPWPPLSASGSPFCPALPALSSFTTGLVLRLSAFALFLRQSTALNYLQLDGCYGEDGEWRELWDAIRTHPNRMTLDIDQIAYHSATELTICHNTGEPSRCEYEDDAWGNIQYSLENYVSGRGHWNKSLRLWFEDGDGESTEEEDGWSEEDDDSEADELIHSGDETGDEG